MASLSLKLGVGSNKASLASGDVLAGSSSGANTPGRLSTRSSDAEDRALLSSHRGAQKDLGLHRCERPTR